MSPGKLCRPRVAYMRSLRPACASTIRSFFGNGEGRVNLNNYFLTAYVSRSWRSVEIARRSSRMRASARPDCTDIRASGRGLPGCGRAETNRKDGQGRHREGTTWRFAHRLSLSRSLQDEEGRSVDEEATSFDRARSPSHTRSRFATRAARVREQATRRGTAARESLCSPPRKAHRSRGMPACGARGRRTGNSAESKGFEPLVPLRVHLISNQAPSATRTALRRERCRPRTVLSRCEADVL